MKFNQWTLGLAAAGVVSLGWAAQAEEAQQAVMTALNSTTISGYVNTSAILRFGHGNISPGRSYDGAAKQDGFNLDVVKLQIEKPLDEGQWAAGYQIGLLFGPDASTLNTTSTAGWGNSDFAIKDANVTLRAPVGSGLDFKMGYWESPIGYEVFDAGNNPNYSRSFGYFIEPKQFTGLLASYKFNDMFSAAAGVANRGLDNFGFWGINPVNTINGRSGADDVLSYLASVAITAPESAGFLSGGTLYAGIIDSGTDLMGGGNPADIQNYYVGFVVPTPLTGVVFGAAFDYRASDSSSNPNWDGSYASTIAGYISWQATEKMKLNARVEYAKGSDGTWYDTDADGLKGDSNELLGVTATVDYNLWANVLTRLEFRWDHNYAGQGCFNDGTDENALSLALNVIYKF
ncbi:MAG TPA: outer membrane beta-barrel protein [Verrucomicrobiota bacterium]|nr:outer membrane beta-barrel protein [Verrucomicrobiota bacterium]HNU49902.1 outer membrane beta-barrel protein [Verrucomicrobiota bacterium]